MRIRWRGLELPHRVVLDEKVSGETYGKFTIEPFERGFGTTIGNSLRRILLSSLEGAAITSVKIKGAPHEFSSLEGVMEDVTDVILNVKDLVVDMDTDDTKTMRLQAEGPGEVTAELIEADSSIEILNPERLLATLTKQIDFDMEFVVERGRGYVPASEQYDANKDQEVGVIPVDANFSPVTRVRYRTDDTRVGQKTNYDKLTLEIWTNGTTTPEMALVEAAKVLRKHLNPFVMYYELGKETASEQAAAAARVDEELIRKLQMPVSELDLSVRANNCLESAKASVVADLVAYTEADLMKVRSFGKTSLREVKRKLSDLGLELGMSLPPEIKKAVDINPV
ncbi:DNA-directed RNA polymerase subunit alpha [Poriferisphaera sp. WC338]|uniref:DNA-directed RNA polymerase subunit alpha n=1 Tax=Poriferisphaera sp. WC338 TaxID=3425129 RepID=UPI003D819CAA